MAILDDLITSIVNNMTMLKIDIDKVDNKSARKRVRKLSLELNKQFKVYRKLSL